MIRGENALKKRRERIFRKRERAVIHGERKTGGALHGVRGFPGGQRIRAAEKTRAAVHVPRGVHRRGSGLRRRFGGCFRRWPGRSRRRSRRAEKPDAGAEERERRKQRNNERCAQSDEPDVFFPAFHRLFRFVYLDHGMPPKKCAKDAQKMSGARSAAHKASQSLLPQAHGNSLRQYVRRRKNLSARKRPCDEAGGLITADGRREPCKGSRFLHPKRRTALRRCARSR